MTKEEVRKNYEKELDYLISKLGFEDPHVVAFGKMAETILYYSDTMPEILTNYTNEYFENMHKETEKMIKENW